MCIFDYKSTLVRNIGVASMQAQSWAYQMNQMSMPGKTYVLLWSHYVVYKSSSLNESIT